MQIGFVYSWHLLRVKLGLGRSIVPENLEIIIKLVEFGKLFRWAKDKYWKSDTNGMENKASTQGRCAGTRFGTSPEQREYTICVME